MEQTVIIIVSSVILLIFPLFLGLKFRLNGSEKSAYYSIKLFGITVSKGRLVLSDEKDGIKVFKKGKLSKTIYWRQFFTYNSAIKPFSDYSVTSVKTCLMLGDKDSIITPFIVLNILSFISEFFMWFFALNKPYLKIDNSFFVLEQKDVFDFKINIKILFNVLMVLLSVIKIVMEKIINGSKNRKQNKQSC